MKRFVFSTFVVLLLLGCSQNAEAQKFYGTDSKETELLSARDSIKQLQAQIDELTELMYGLRGIKMFDETDEKFTEKSLKVFQTLSPGTGLATMESYDNDEIYYGDGLTVLYFDNFGRFVYDDLVVKTSANEHFYLIGVYSYETTEGVPKTIPVVAIYED